MAPIDVQTPEPVARMREAFAAAAASGAATHELTGVLAGRPVRVRVVGALLAERTLRPFAHLREAAASSEPAALEIELWDEAETGVACPLAGGPLGLGEERLAAGGTLAASPDGHAVAFRYEGSITLLDREAGRLVGCRRSGSQLSGGERSKPFVVLLSVWLHDRGAQLVHAALVARGGAGVLVPGVSGSGKSTTALGCVVQGLDYLGDDFVGIEPTTAGFLGHSLYDTACLARDGLARFPGLQALAVDDGFPGEEKPILFLSDRFPERLRRTVPVRAIVLLDVGRPRTGLARVGRPEALRELAASTLHTVVPRPGRAALALLGALVEQAPAWRLSLGPDLDGLDDAIARVVADSGGATA